VLCVFRTVKYYFKSEVEFERQVTDTDEVQHTAQFYVPLMISASDPLDIHSVISSVQTSIEAFTSRGSGWNVSQILNLSLSMGVFRPTAWSSFTKTPPEIAKKRAIINPRNFDNNCFQYSILAAIHPITANAPRCSIYTKYLCELDMTGIETHVSLSSIPKFEVQNPSISVSVLVYEKKDLIPVYTSKFLNEWPHHVNLLLLSKGDTFHYTLIKSLVSYLAGQSAKVRPTSVRIVCIHSDTNTVSRIISRNAVGIQPRPQSIPKKAKKFSNLTKFSTFPVQFLLYTDFESYLTSSGEHVPSGFCCLRVSKFSEHDHKIFTYSGDNVLKEFFEHIKNEQNDINKILSTNLPMNPLTDEETRAHDAATACLSCENKFTTSTLKYVITVT